MTVANAEPPSDDLPAVRVLAGGVLMGLANLVPGVSGGTMILALGLYDRFIGAIADATRLKLSVRTVLFLGLIGSGAAVAVLGLSGVAVGLVAEHRWIMYSLFIGMTLGGAPQLLRECRPVRAGALVAFLLALAGMAALAKGLSDSTLAPTIPVLAFVGALAASSMILPGVSGSYILLIFGLYDIVIGSLSASELLEDPAASLKIILPVGVGALLGIALLSNLLKHVLSKYAAVSHAALLGLLVGSVIGLWPFSEPVHPDLANKRVRKTVTMLVGGTSLAEANEKAGADLDPARAEQLSQRYAGKSAGELKQLSMELERFDPTGTQIATAVGLLLAGFAMTRVLGGRASGQPAAS